MKTSRKIVYIVVVIVIIILGIFAIQSAKNKEKNLPVAKQYPVVVSTIQPEQKMVLLTLPFLAEAANDKDVNLSSKISARVKYIKPSGSRVKKGEVIVRLDNTSIQSNNSSLDAQITAQQAILNNLIETHKRTKELLDIKGASLEQYQKEESNIAAVTSKIESLKSGKTTVNNTLTYATITSPVDGIISKTLVHKGDMCMPGHPVAKLSATNGFFLMLRVPKEVNVKGVNFENNYYEAIALNSTFNGLAEYKIYLPNTIKLTSGDRFEVDVVVFKDKAIILPFDAVLNRNGKSFVLIKVKDSITATPITVLETGEQGIAIKDKAIEGKNLIVAKQDIMLKILGGNKVITKNN